MQVCHVESAVFDDPNLVSCAGLGPVVALAEQCGLPQLVAAQLTLPAKAGVNAHLKVPALPGADRVAYVDIDDTVKATYGYAKQGAGYGYSGVKGLNALLATVSSPLAAPVIVATRLRKGSTNSARGAPRLVADALAAAKAAGAGGPHGDGLVVLRADSAFYSHDVVAAARQPRPPSPCG